MNLLSIVNRFFKMCTNIYTMRISHQFSCIITVLHTCTATCTHSAINNTHSREEGLHVLVGVCYRRQIHQISVQHLLISVQVEIHHDGL